MAEILSPCRCNSRIVITSSSSTTDTPTTDLQGDMVGDRQDGAATAAPSDKKLGKITSTKVGSIYPTLTLVYWMNTALVLLLWTGLWAGLHGLRHARHSELARLRAEAERSALERDALRARLNPHFMFNALNNLRALILEDPERARDMATRLSRTLRHALAHNRSEQVTLAEELAVVDDYLAIEAIHFEQRLRVRRDIAVGAGQAQLPAMALQLLVENAIKHGIATRPGGGEVRIRATLDDGLLRLQVDNPIGTGSPETHGHGVGLAYLRAQLGTRGRFALQSVEERMQAIVEIPQ
ncbi:sensor histidine kinase [Burkholderia sp. LMG 21824]